MFEYGGIGATAPVIGFAIAWGFVLLLSFAGWGLAVGRLLGDELRDDLGQAVARGISLMVVVGGGLNLLRLVSAPMILGLVAVGLSAAALLARPGEGFRRWPGAGRPLHLLAWAIAILAYLNWLYFVWPSSGSSGAYFTSYDFNASDDACYLVHPVRMLQTGWLSLDPFNMSQTGSALGGESFLQTFVLAVLPVNYTHLIDPGVAYLAMAVLVISMVGRPWLAVLMLLLYASIPSYGINCTAIGLPAVLLLAIYRECQGGRLDRDPLRVSAAVALPLAALLALKTTLIPGGVAIIAFERAFAAMAERRVLRPMAIGLLVGGLAFLLIVPWMIASYASCGSPLYPFLGEGYRAYSTYAMPHKQAGRSLSGLLTNVRILLGSPPVVACPFFGLLAAWALRRDRSVLPTWFAFLAGSMAYLGLMLVVFSLGDFVRYTYPFRAFILVQAFAILLGDPRDEPVAAPRPRPAFAALIWLGLAGLIVHGSYRNIQRSPFQVAARSAFAGRGQFSPEEVAAYHRLQEALPGARTVLFSEGHPFLMDFRRNPIYALDRPGAVSPPPGLPLDGTAEDVAAYLRASGIDYLAWDHRQVTLSAPLPPFGYMEEGRWLLSMLLLQKKWFQKVVELSERYETRYQDKCLSAIDLTRPRAVRAEVGAGFPRPPSVAASHP